MEQVEKDDRKIGQEHLIASGRCDSVFEAIMVIGKRTRQINEKNRKDFEESRRTMVDVYGDKERKKESYNEDFSDLPTYEKAERVALHEFLDGKLEYDYHDLSRIEE